MLCFEDKCHISTNQFSFKAPVFSLFTVHPQSPFVLFKKYDTVVELQVTLKSIQMENWNVAFESPSHVEKLKPKLLTPSMFIALGL